MIILPKQAGVALGLLAFTVASLAGIFSSVTLEVAILRGGISFLFFSVFGWLVAYLVYDEQKPGKVEAGTAEIDATKDLEQADSSSDDEVDITDEIETQDLKPPDDSDF